MHSTLFVGGCRSGKSALALRRAEALSKTRVFVATARPVDVDMQRRIARHQAERGEGWTCREAPLDLQDTAQEAAGQAGVVVIDCVSFWLCNLMERGLSPEHILTRVKNLGRLLTAPSAPMIVVTHESGCGVAPATAIGNLFRDLNGETNQILAQSCHNVFFVTCGLPLPLKTTPEIRCA